MPISGNLAEFDVAAILALMHHQALDGQLKISTATFHKTLWVENGCIIFAQSSLIEDSLGSFLLRRQVIDARSLEKSSAYMQNKSMRRGRALLEMGLLNSKQLWDEVSAHLHAIVFSLFPLPAGKYDIVAHPKNGSENILLNVPVPEIILEGIRQIQDQPFIESRFREDMVLFPNAVQNHFPAKLKPFEAHVLSLAAAGSSVAEIIAKSELLRFDTLKILYSLLETWLPWRLPAAGAPPDSRQRQPCSDNVHFV